MFNTTVYKKDNTRALTGYIHYSLWGTGLTSVTWQLAHVPNGIIAHGAVKSHNAAKIAITKAMKANL
jgi:hypothetical protein